MQIVRFLCSRYLWSYRPAGALEFNGVHKVFILQKYNIEEPL